MRNFLLALVPVLSLVGCSFKSVDAPPPAESTSSHEITDMRASLSAQSEGDKIRVYAALLVKSGAFLDLASGDSLTATVGTETHALARVAEGDKIHYEADFTQPPTAVAATISFHRADGRRGGDSQVMVPAPFNLTVTPAASVSHTGSLSLDVPGVGTSANDFLNVDVTGVCVRDGQQTISVTVTKEKALLDMTQVTLADAKVAECDLELSVQALQSGHVDPAFAPDIFVTQFQGVQRRVTKTHMTK
jgi:hypothetical protein